MNGGFLHEPPNPRVPCHCLVHEHEGGLGRRGLDPAGVRQVVLTRADPDPDEWPDVPL